MACMGSCFGCCFSNSKSKLTYRDLVQEQHAAPDANTMGDYGGNPLLTVRTLPMTEDVGGQFAVGMAKIISQVPWPITLQVRTCPDTVMSYKKKTIESHNVVDHGDNNDEGGQGCLTVDANSVPRSSAHVETSVEMHKVTANNSHVVKNEKVVQADLVMPTDRQSCSRVNANATTWFSVRENESVTVLVGFYDRRQSRWQASKCTLQRGTVVVCSLVARSGQDPVDEYMSTTFDQAMDEMTHHAPNPKVPVREEAIRAFLMKSSVTQPLPEAA